MNEDCGLCAALTGAPSPAIQQLFPQLPCPTEVIERTGGLAVIVDAAPVRIGHVLVVSGSHERSLLRWWREGHLSAVADRLAGSIRRVLSEDVVFCEHGLGPEAASRAGCVEHAHLHVIPVRRSVAADFASVVDLKEDGELERLLERRPDAQYIRLRDADGRWFSAVGQRLPSQLVRRVVARAHDETFWSWRDFIDFSERIGTQGRVLDTVRVFAA